MDFDQNRLDNGTQSGSMGNLARPSKAELHERPRPELERYATADRIPLDELQRTDS